MTHRSAHFGPDTLRTMTAALNEAWADSQKVFAGLTAGICLPAMAAAVLEAAARGERDPVRLRQAALSGLGGECPMTRH
jgi:threonine/homoserine/homoserine lactone efflux protein